jgi:photosystem II stability/assembly factor-like uncharacterized protein
MEDGKRRGNSKNKRSEMTIFMKAFVALVFVCSIYPDLVYSQTVKYDWNQLKIGGGGYVTGMVVHPGDKDIKYIRTDVGGAYAWDVKESKWRQMLDFLSVAEANLIGVDGIAVDPNSPDRVYMALGRHGHVKGGLYRSENRGKTWTKLFSANYESNSPAGRWVGECIAIDPHSSKVIYTGTRKKGLWRSVDDGKNWLKLNDVPDDERDKDAAGIRSIVFDSGTKLKGRSARIFAGLPGKGIYYSEDGGASFSRMTGGPINPARMQVAGRALFVTHDSGVAKWSDGKWQDVTPQSDKKYVGLAVDTRDNRKVIVAQWREGFNNAMYRSDDGGLHWTQLNTKTVPANLHTNIPWWPRTWFSSATSTLCLSPRGSGELYYTDWFATWRTPNIWADSIDWHLQVKGHEETVILTLLAPPSGALVYSGMADIFGFRHERTEDYPAKRLHPLNECFSIAVCEKMPSQIAVLGAKTWGGDHTQLWTSPDHGDNWTERTLPKGARLGRIAVAPNNPKMMVYVTATGDAFHTSDHGNTWKVSNNAPKHTLNARNIWDKYCPLASDMIDQTFYLFKEGTLYSSIDGANWVAKNLRRIPVADGSLNVVAVPGRKGALWISLHKNGLWQTYDAGKTFSKINGIRTATAFSWGAPAAEGGVPTAYCYGTIGDNWGLYRSQDMGQNWSRINDDQHQFPAGVQAIAGDRNTFGQVYIGTGGLGIVFGKPAAAGK